MSTHKEYALIAILATAAIVGIGPAFGYCPPDCAPKSDYTGGLMTGDNSTNVQAIVIPGTFPITVTTDKPTYDRQSTIVVTGNVLNPIPGQAVTLRVSDPNGNFVQVNQVTVDNNGNFQATINTSSPLWTSDGTYTILAQYGSQQGLRTAQAQFSIGVATNVQTCTGSQLSATLGSGNYCIDYSITGGTATGATLDQSSKTLSVSIQSTDDGQITLNIPRSVLDAKAGVKDGSFFVLVDGQEKDDFTDTSSATTRTLTIPFTAGAER